MRSRYGRWLRGLSFVAAAATATLAFLSYCSSRAPALGNFQRIIFDAKHLDADPLEVAKYPTQGDI